MKKTLLWLSTLACLTLAGLYAYAWFNRDPLAVAFEHIADGMTLEEASAIIGQPPFGKVRYRDGQADGHCTIWDDAGLQLHLISQDGRVVHKNLYPRKSIAEKAVNWVRGLWRPVPPPVPVPTASTPRVPKDES